MSGKDWRKKMFSDVDGRQTEKISDDNVFQTSDAANGNVRRPTVVGQIFPPIL